MRPDLGRLGAIAELLQVGSFLGHEAGSDASAQAWRAWRHGLRGGIYSENAGSIPMRILGAAAVIALLTGPAYAQVLPNVNLIPEIASKTPEEKEQEATQQKAYRESLKKIPDAKVSSDPWGNIRSVDSPKTSAPAKPRTKTGSTIN